MCRLCDQQFIFSGVLKGFVWILAAAFSTNTNGGEGSASHMSEGERSLHQEITDTHNCGAHA